MFFLIHFQQYSLEHHDITNYRMVYIHHLNQQMDMDGIPPVLEKV